MKNSRKYIIIALLAVALFMGGAVLGSVIPNVLTFAMIGAAAVAAALLIFFGYTGVKKEDDR